MHHQKLLPEQIIEYLKKRKLISELSTEEIKRTRSIGIRSSWEFPSLKLRFEFLEPNHDSFHRTTMLIVQDEREKKFKTVFTVLGCENGPHGEEHSSTVKSCTVALHKKEDVVNAEALRTLINAELVPEIQLPEFEKIPAFSE